MASKQRKSSVLFISTFPPKKCGIASFTYDLAAAIRLRMDKALSLKICALDKTERGNLYSQSVRMVMDGHNVNSCFETAADINSDELIKLVCIEHEFGLYGGELGEYLLGFLSMLEKPFIIRFHTVLPNPGNKMLTVVQSIAMLAEKIIVMTKNSDRLLIEDYHIAAEKIIVIPHGTHDHSTTPQAELKIKYNLEGKQVLTTFGLLSPNKGIEKGILAMKEISACIPNAMYVVLGQTHPTLFDQEGEKYREYLQQLITENGLQHNVLLINEYAPTEKLMEYLALTDIYLFTSKDPDQAVSGTFLYAMSAGCPIISNTFVLAKEMLDETTGIMISPGNEHQLAENAIRILQNSALKKAMGENAFLKTRDTTWEKVGQKHATLFNEILGIPATPFELLNSYVH